MVRLQNTKVYRFFKHRKLAKLVRAGTVPLGVPKEEIWEALKATRPRGVTETFGFVSAKVFDKSGRLKQDCGLQSVKEITGEFVNYLADAMMDSGKPMSHWDKHAMGDGSTAETDTQTALVNQQDGRNTGTQTHGASSNIYKSVATITAGAAYTAIEHGIFDTLTATDDILLDRSVLASPPTLATDDEVEWTYELTINAGG